MSFSNYPHKLKIIRTLSSGLIFSLILSGCSSLLIHPSPDVTASKSSKPAHTTKIAEQTDRSTSPVQKEISFAETRQAPQVESLNSGQPEDGRIAEHTKSVETIDFWERLRKGFKLSIPDNKKIQRELAWYKKHPEYLKRVQERAAPYLFYILQEAEKRQIPTELVLLPVVESAFQPFAYSPGRASGLWQFIPSTGRSFGLKQTWWYDGRRDVIRSTNAAFDYLTALSKKFDGDWELALAAYNTGAGNVRKAIRRNRKRHKPTDYWSLKLPRETASYVPRLLAISQLIKNADTFGIQLESVELSPYFAEVDIDSQIDLAKAAELADISIEEMYQLNPAYNRWATDPDGPFSLLIPARVQKQFTEKLAKLDKNERLQWKRYTIKKGDSLSRIAHRYKTTTKVLKKINRLASNRIRAGKHLLIPVSSKAASAYALSVTQRLATKQQKKRSGNRIDYTVNPGDTLWDIAKLYKVSWKKLAAWNGIAPRDVLRPGQKLVLWTPNTQSTQIATLSPKLKLISRQSNIRYTIRKGDSLSRIAERFNIRVSDLKKWNRIKSRYIHPGQTLKLKIDVTEQTTL